MAPNHTATGLGGASPVEQEHADTVIEFGGVCIDCGPDQVENMVAFYVATLGAEGGPPRGEVGFALRSTPHVHQHSGPGLVRATCVARTRGGPEHVGGQNTWGARTRGGPEHVGGQTKMIHFECGISGIEAAVALVIQSGGMVPPYQPYDRDPNQLVVVLDPAGHPICLIAS
ncbi:VOC family protein [Actinopolymorpha sp. B11F2]|uniref:VOC family protein n=1 Tax=Actinopolymorpha sp. B11F2 TaxID=3160862 RepID=UPI0032E4201F